MLTTALRRATTAVATVLLAAGAASAQDLGHKAPPQTRPIVLTHATVHPVSGPALTDASVLIERGKIAAVGRVSIPGGGDYEVVDCAGLHVYPGLIAANTVLGLTEINAVRSTQDAGETGDITPEVRAAVAVNPDSTLLPVTRANGVLVAATIPESGAIPGRLSVIRLEGWTWEDMAVLDDAGLVVNWPFVRPVKARWMRKSEEEQLEDARKNLEKINEAFDAAAAYTRARAADPTVETDVRWEAMRPAINGEKPVFIRAQDLEQIESAVAWAVARKLKPVIIGGRDAADCLDLLKRHDVAVIVTGTHRLPKRDDSAYDEPYTLPLELEKAGIRWCLATTGGSFQAPHERNLPYNAAMAVAFGLDHDAALRSITLAAAEILGVADTLGSIDVGKSATLIVTDGDPMEITTHVERAYIDGRTIDLTNKQTELAKKYREKYRQLGVTPAATEGAGK